MVAAAGADMAAPGLQPAPELGHSAAHMKSLVAELLKHPGGLQSLFTAVEDGLAGHSSGLSDGVLGRGGTGDVSQDVPVGACPPRSAGPPPASPAAGAGPSNADFGGTGCAGLGHDPCVGDGGELRLPVTFASQFLGPPAGPFLARPFFLPPPIAMPLLAGGSLNGGFVPTTGMRMPLPAGFSTDPVGAGRDMVQPANAYRRMLNGGAGAFAQVRQLALTCPLGNPLVPDTCLIIDLKDGAMQCWTGNPDTGGEGCVVVYPAGSVIVGGQEPGRSIALQKATSWTSVNYAPPRKRKHLRTLSSEGPMHFGAPGGAASLGAMANGRAAAADTTWQGLSFGGPCVGSGVATRWPLPHGHDFGPAGFSSASTGPSSSVGGAGVGSGFTMPGTLPHGFSSAGAGTSPWTRL